MADKEAIKKLWSDEDFPGAFSGINTFQHELKRVKNIVVTRSLLRKYLHEIPTYLQHVIRRKPNPRRSYESLYGYGQLWQCDLAKMSNCENFEYILLCIDVYTRFIWTEPLTDKKSETVKEALKKIYKDANVHVTALSTDQGTEFIGCHEFFKSQKTYFSIKRGKNKASFSEAAIFKLKRKLFQYMRYNHVDNWVKPLPTITANINKMANPAIGGLVPVDVRARIFDPVVAEARSKSGNPVTNPSYVDAMANQEKYEKDKSKLQVGDYVYADKSKSQFNKSYDVQVCIYINLHLTAAIFLTLG